MNFNNFFLRSFRILLFPFSLIYGAIVIIRNYLYDKGFFKSTSFNIPIIGVGNLSVGGTGKSPMVEYLVALLKYKYRIATLSRGYKRRTSGYMLAKPGSSALEIGDEPMQFHLKHPEIAVAVGEQRTEAVPQLLFDRPDLDLIVLDDAFQHRAIQSGLNILLTEFNDLYVHDFFLPTGDLRDQKKSACRADVIVVTKCKAGLHESEEQKVRKLLNPEPHQHLFFTSIRYGIPYHIVTRENKQPDRNTEVLLVCGIANPQPLKKHLQENTKSYEALYYQDHHIFIIDDLREIIKQFNRIEHADKMIITTEKDAVRLVKYSEELKNIPFYVLPISVGFLFNGGPAFNDLVVNFIGTFRTGQRNINETNNGNEKQRN